MTSQITNKKFDLDERTFLFARRTRNLIKTIPKNTVDVSDRDQLTRSSGSVAANYVEANEALSTRDFVMRIKICRKEAKESHLWLRLIRDQLSDDLRSDCDSLLDESIQLVKIFHSIAAKFPES
jgi:four helix bundle protein